MDWRVHVIRLFNQGIHLTVWHAEVARRILWRLARLADDWPRACEDDKVRTKMVGSLSVIMKRVGLGAAVSSFLSLTCLGPAPNIWDFLYNIMVSFFRGSHDSFQSARTLLQQLSDAVVPMLYYVQLCLAPGGHVKTVSVLKHLSLYHSRRAWNMSVSWPDLEPQPKACGFLRLWCIYLYFEVEIHDKSGLASRCINCYQWSIVQWDEAYIQL